MGECGASRKGVQAPTPSHRAWLLFLLQVLQALGQITEAVRPPGPSVCCCLRDQVVETAAICSAAATLGQHYKAKTEGGWGGVEFCNQNKLMLESFHEFICTK